MNEVLVLASGPWRAEVVPARGGRVARLSFAGGQGPAEVLEPVVEWQPQDRPWPAAGLYPLVPYSNRIENGRLRVGGREVQLRVHAFAQPHAQHGPGHLRPWDVESCSPSAVRLRLAYEADEDWPWSFESALAYGVTDGRFTARIDVRNRSAEPMPAGVGLHPFFRASAGTTFVLGHRDRWPQAGDDPPEPRFGTDESEIRAAVSQDLLLLCLGRWARTAAIERPDLHIRVTASPLLSHLIVYRAAGSGFLCLEPVSHVTNGFNFHAAGLPHTGTHILLPGEALEAEMAIACAPPPASTRAATDR